MSTNAAVGWMDMSCPEADALKDFYAEVMGWRVEPVDMGGYADYSMLDAEGRPMAGICHNRGANADIPTNVWIPYLRVPDVAAAVTKAEALGAVRCTPIKDCPGYGEFCVLKDPSGTVVALARFDAA